jgi:hypothetical protein
MEIRNVYMLWTRNLVESGHLEVQERDKRIGIKKIGCEGGRRTASVV